MENVFGLAEMRRRLTGYSVSIAISAVANLRIADFLSERPMTSAELAGLSGSDEQFLRRLLQFLASEQVFEELEGDVFALTEQSRWLRSDVPGSLRPRAVFAGCALNWMAWGSLLGSVKTGKSAIQLTFGETLFDHLKSHPADANVFNTFMAEQTAASVESILSAYSFSGVREIVDVGGGHGALVAGVLRSYADLRGVLFDTPEVVASAASFLDRAGVIDRCRLMGGDFFNEMPTGSDLYALKFILHDWPDAEADTFPFHPTEFSKPQLEAFHRVGRTCDDDANPLHGAPPLKAARRTLAHTIGNSTSRDCPSSLPTGLVWAAAGAMLTGFGYSLVYPGLGVEAVRRAPPQEPRLAMGAYTALLDVALGFGSPALGLMASWAGLGSAFLAGALIVLCAAAIAVRLLAVRGTLITKASFTNGETAAASSWRARRIKGATLANFSG